MLDVAVFARPFAVAAMRDEEGEDFPCRGGALGKEKKYDRDNWKEEKQ